MPRPEATLDTAQLQAKVENAFFPSNHSNSQDHVGLELELWPFRTTPERGHALVPFQNEEGTGLIQLLQQLVGTLEGFTYEPKPDGTHIFKFADGGNLTFEPGRQLEYSGPPFATLTAAIQNLNHVIETLRCQLKNYDIWFFHSGLNPWYTVDEVGLHLTAPRYINMDRYFHTIGHYGRKMMRLSTSLQINLDAGDKATAQRRWLAANLVPPFFVALFANSPFIHRKAGGAYSYRSLIWQNLDPSRTGIQKGFLTPEYKPCPVQQYTEFALDANVMRLPQPNGEASFDGRFINFRQWMKDGYNGQFPDMEDWVNHLSTLFPEVRARGFFECRFLDAQSKVWCAVPGILLTFLLYNTEAREKTIDMLLPYRTQLPGLLQQAAVQGLEDEQIAALSNQLFQLALKHAGSEDRSLVALAEKFYENYTHRGLNPAAELLQLNDGKVFTPEQYRNFEKKQVDHAGELLETICEFC
ncbi:glutamate-cysteine ligase family protein [Acanthopleuribacter pedis]|uniref:Glutamate--cysteine ligase n=1 Tax=Acanthopleuribacter pedis TaxID=442870 RepID=A0A8J7Q7M6_9BACT|nr:glutamate-cysteine ligase family protein [Acanthopleuribacter pedis]MBO1318834.1 hypothetical protein [Acanthopleuribacter pedis]